MSSVLAGGLSEEEVVGEIVEARERRVVVSGIVFARKIGVRGPVAHEPIQVPKSLRNPSRDVAVSLPRSNILKHCLGHTGEGHPIPAQVTTELHEERAGFRFELGS